jgi:hypothetical protein
MLSLCFHYAFIMLSLCFIMLHYAFVTLRCANRRGGSLVSSLNRDEMSDARTWYESTDRSYPITRAASSQQLGLVFEAEVSTSDRTQEILAGWDNARVHEIS